MSTVDAQWPQLGMGVHTMDKLPDWIPAALLLIGLAMIASSETDCLAAKEDLYDECITTDYDKFQCYAMIYGDK